MHLPKSFASNTCVHVVTIFLDGEGEGPSTKPHVDTGREL